MMSPELLDRLSREDLVARAKALGAERPELMTRVELRDEIVRLSEPDEAKRRQSRGWFGAARDLLASVVESGLHMPDAAALIRGETRLDANVGARPPVATVTLAEIYAAQGHADRALHMLAQVLQREPEHETARALRERLTTDPERRRRGGTVTTQAVVAKGGPVEVAATLPEAIAPEPSQLEVAAPESSADERDAVALIVEGERLYVYWELSASSVEQARRNDPSGVAVVRIVHFIPSWGGAQREEHDIAAAARQGFAVAVRKNTRAVARAALGWRSETSFMPFAVATEIASSLDADGRIHLQWAPPHCDAEVMTPIHRRALQKYFEQG